jgi:hypothetical protein
MSAYTPPTIVIGALAKMPVRRRNTTNEPQLGDNAHADVKTVKQKKVGSRIVLRPYISLRGPNAKGPKT